MVMRLLPTVQLGLSKRRQIRQIGLLIIIANIFWAAATCTFRTVEAFQRLSAPHLLCYNRHRQLASSLDGRKYESRTRLFEGNGSLLGQSSGSELIGTVAILVPSSSSSSGPSKFAVSEDAALLSYFDAASGIANEVSTLSLNSIEVYVEALLTPSASSPTDLLATTRQRALDADVLLGLGLSNPADVRYLSTLFRERRLTDTDNSKRCQFALDCGKPFAPIVGPYDEANPNFLCKIPWTEEAKGRESMYEMMDMFAEWNVADFSRAIVLFFDRFG